MTAGRYGTNRSGLMTIDFWIMSIPLNLSTLFF